MNAATDKINKDKKIHTDFLLIGSGISGLSVALRLCEYGSVLIITKGARDEGATAHAQGGIAAAISEEDHPDNHLKDTLEAGAGLCDPQAVEFLVKEGVERVQELITQGMLFSRDPEGKIHLGREGGHKQSRVLHVHDSTGREVENFLLATAKEHKNITILENHMLVDLITEHHTGRLPNHNTLRCYGAYALNESDNEIYTVIASYVVMASGGAGRVYPFTTNPAVNTGDGIATAYRAGCRVRNMEFIQFHPTVFYAKADPAFLISEALRGHGARLFNDKNERFMQKYHEMLELAPRDIVARAIDNELKLNGSDCVYLDVTHLDADDIKANFPLIHDTLHDRFHLDITKERIPVVPAAHYTCGGIVTDLNGKSDIDFFYAVGETASSGVHGANRLASNSLLEGLVFGKRAADHICKNFELGEHQKKEALLNNITDWKKDRTVNMEEWVLVKHDLAEIQSLMWDYVGIVRSNLRLKKALRRINMVYEEIREYYQTTCPTREILELRNIAKVAQLITRSALARKESRGLHFSTDYPEDRSPSRADTILEPKVYRLYGQSENRT